MKRGEVRWYTFQAPDKRRLVLVLTRNSSIGVLNAVTVAPITSTIRDVPSEVLLDADDGLLNECVANLHRLQTVPKTTEALKVGIKGCGASRALVQRNGSATLTTG